MGKNKINENFVQFPNFYMDRVMALLSSEEWKILSYFVRRTYGFHKMKDRISLSQFIDGIKSSEGEYLDHGTGLARNTVRKGIDLLAKAKIIKILEKSPGGRKTTLYEIQDNFSQIDIKYLQSRKGTGSFDAPVSTRPPKGLRDDSLEGQRLTPQKKGKEREINILRTPNGNNNELVEEMKKILKGKLENVK